MKGKKAQPKQAEKSPEKEKSPQNKKEEQKKSSSNSKPKDSKDAKDNKDKTKNKGGKDPVPKLEKKEPQKPKYKLDFIYRREKYTLKNLAENFLVSKMKKLIAKEINVDIKALKFFYKEKEIKEDEDKNNLYQMIKDDTFPIIEVKKEILNEQNIISLNTKVNLVYKVECKQITDYIDFISKIEQFFKDICIENHYLCEPIANNKYNVCFLCSDHCFQFKRYMMNISRMEKLYEKSTYKVLGADKSQIIEPEVDLKNEEEDESYGKIEKIVVTDKKNNKDIEIQFRKIKHKENDYFQKDFINKGPYESEDTKKKQTDEKNKSKKKKKKEFTVY